MIRKMLLPGLAVGLFAFAVLHVVRAAQTGPTVMPPVEPVRSPYGNTVAGAGILEAETENIAIGSHLPGVVTEVYVHVGDTVSAGTAMFRLDERQMRAQLKSKQADLLAAKAQLAKLEQMPRPEEVPPSEAKVNEAKANLADQEDQLKRAKKLYSSRAIGDEEMVRRQTAYQATREQLVRAEAEHKLLKAGAWEADKAMSRAAVGQAEAQIEQIQTELDRLLVTASVDGEVLQVNVRPGEYVGAPPGQALVVLGNVHQLHLRVDIDEHDIPRFKPTAKARASVRGHSDMEFPLRFVRVEPYVVPKKSLTGDNSERVDTRVLQVIYAVDAGDATLYVGQQMDVFIEAK
jgi:multidrug resistance efflux pump